MNSPVPQQWTILTLLSWTENYFKTHGIGKPRLDAEILLAHQLGMTRVNLYMNFEKPMSTEDLSAYKILIKRRITHEPIAYITGKKEFWSLPFEVGPGVLIPRPETELILETILATEFKNRLEEPLSILDIGTGSGVLSIALAHEFGQASITTLENSPDAIVWAKKNIATHQFESRINLIETDFLKFESKPNSFNIIVSNPPYIASQKIAELEKNVKDFEPLTALDGGIDGLAFYHKIGEGAARWLKEGGLLVVEIGDEQGDAVKQIFEKCGLTNSTVIKDYAGLPRVIKALH